MYYPLPNHFHHKTPEDGDDDEIFTPIMSGGDMRKMPP
jgi:hypothetical protein